MCVCNCNYTVLFSWTVQAHLEPSTLQTQRGFSSRSTAYAYVHQWSENFHKHGIPAEHNVATTSFRRRNDIVTTLWFAGMVQTHTFRLEMNAPGHPVPVNVCEDPVAWHWAECFPSIVVFVASLDTIRVFWDMGYSWTFILSFRGETYLFVVATLNSNV